MLFLSLISLSFFSSLRDQESGVNDLDNHFQLFIDKPLAIAYYLM
ncbi:hypothetical protein QY95_00847 [Bacillus thermotolerans]|uniref:Uncharacterized protein n=1 Tax=Bacillus thermotolerans TaxID=1221996 RepID=A0A0F5I790_BACTR|nr:hypothetical protein QY95_00847 [Bacillus thermotolerans]